MDGGPTNADRRILDEATARFIEAGWPLQQVRRRVDGEPGNEAALPAYLRKAAELGWFANFVSELHGGGSVSGHPVLDAVAIGVRRGAVLQPGPWVSSNVVADVLTRFGSADQQRRYLPSLATADLGAAWLSDSVFEAETSGFRAEPTGDEFRLVGRGLAVEATTCDLFVVSAWLDGDFVHCCVPRQTAGVDLRILSGIDLSRAFFTVSLHDVTVEPEAVIGAGTGTTVDTERAVALAAVLASAETVGGMAQLFAMTLDYAKSRIAFGQPIGAFQAIKHQLADLSLRLECCQAGLSAAAADLDRDAEWAAEAASIVKAFVADSATTLAQGCLQIHGGIGFTWEHDLHLYYRRLAADAAVWGDAAWHREHVCALQGI